MALTISPEVFQSEEKILSSGPSTSQTFLGLGSILWRIAFVTGIAQLSVSIWIWQFAISLEPILNPLQIGLTFTIGALASLVGYPIAGAMADVLGRKRTLLASFIPQIVGLTALYLLPTWPLVLFSFGLHSFGWSFVLVISKAMPADIIAGTTGPDASRKFAMVLMPAFLVDGISPIIAVFLISIGFSMHSLLLIGIVAAGVALAAAARFVVESMNPETRKKIQDSTRRPLRDLGRSFWIFTGGMVGYYIAWGMSLPYIGILIISEWSIGLDIYGLSSSIFSLATVTLMYSLSGFSGRDTKSGLTISLFANAIIMTTLGLGSGTLLLILLNLIWAAPIVVWITAETVLTINGVPSEMKGRALGIYQFATSATGLIGAPLGALVWIMGGNLRFLWIVSGVLAIGFAVIVWMAMIRVKIHKGKSKKRIDLVP
ncbi:MAG: MFS transporter [Candidatus Thorarchaeota archaeon]